MSHRKTLTLALGLGIVLATVLGTAPAAQAQYAPGYYPPPPPPPPRGVYRGGLVWGFSVGPGGFTYSDCSGLCGFAPMGEFHIGGMIAPRLALMGDFWAGAHYFSNSVDGTGETWNGVYTLAAQYWVNDIIWLKGGLGFSYITVGNSGYYYSSISDSGFAFLLAAGIEIMQVYNFAMDLQFRYGNSAYTSASRGGPGDTSMYGGMIGFNWY
jgi:hypothetical protein